ncbi:hypothetical protein D9M72_478490 [compost metagenome]
MHLLAVVALQALMSGADRKQPVGAHLHVVIGCLHRVVVERVALGIGVRRRPDQRFMGVLEPATLEVRHRVGLAPDDIVEDPEVQVLQDGADAEDVVVGADDPERAGRLQYAAAGKQPGAGEGVIGFEGSELIPFVIDGIDHRLIGTGQHTAELEVVGRVGENDVDRIVGKRIERRNAVTLDDAVEPAQRAGGAGDFGKRNN